MTLKNQVAAKDIQISTLKRELDKLNKEATDLRMASNDVLKILAVLRAAGCIRNSQVTAAQSLINPE